MKYLNKSTNQTVKILSFDKDTNNVAYEVDGKTIVEDWNEFLKKFNGIARG